MTFCVPVQGVFATNCYFAIDRESNHGFLIDPGAEGERLVPLILERGWIIEKILLTHGHFDHFGGVDAVRDALDIPVLIHEEGKAYLERPELNLSHFCGGDLTVEGAQYFRDGNLLTLQEGNLQLRVIHTPGHTNDSCVLYDKAEKTAYVGDTIFRGSMGNPDYPTGNERLLLKSIRERVLALPDDTLLCSGHSDVTRVGAEKPRYLWRDES